MRRLVALTLTGVLVAGATTTSLAGEALDAPPAKAGDWGQPFAELAIFAKRPPKNIEESVKIPPAVSMGMLPDGRVIYWGGLEGIEAGTLPVAADGGKAIVPSRVRLLDLRNGEPRWSTPAIEDGGAHDMFCADQRLLPDGRLVVVGGTIWKSDPVDVGPEAPGGTVELFDPNGDRWTKNDEFMQHYRWYPTMITLGNGNLFISSGVARLIYNYSGQNVQETETFDPQTGDVKVNKGESATSLPLFPRLHLLPDGRVYYGGVGQMWGPFGQSVDEALWAIHKAYDPKKETWTTYGMGPYGARSGAFSILMPMKPPYKEARILVAGGTLGSSPGSYVANNLTEIVTVDGESSSSEAGPELNNARWYSSGVLLPDGDVLALSGANRDEVVLPGSESPVMQAELFDGKKWTPLASAGRVRTYHNSAILLPDGSVLVGGHAPINTAYGPGGDNTGEAVTGTNNLKDPSFEIFKPPYLFRGPRPTIAHAQSGVAWGSTFEIASPDAGNVRKVVLSRLPQVTHITDADQRSIELDFSANGGSLRASVPDNPNVLPPGYYYLWLLSDNGEGLTPSNARIVRVGANEIGGEAAAPMGR